MDIPKELEKQNQQTPFSQVPKLHKRHFKSFWPIVIIAVLSALVGGLLVWAAFNQGLEDEINSLIPGANFKHHAPSPFKEMSQTSELKDWHTYTNKEYGFEFKYPQDWNIAQNLFLPSSKIEQCVKEKANNTDCFYFKTLGLLPEEFKYTGAGFSTETSIKISNLKKVNVSGNEFYLLQNNFEAVGDIYYFIRYQDKFLGFVYYQYYDNNSEKTQQIIDQILSTFKFLN